MKQDEAVSTILGCSISGYYKWKKQNRLIINLLEKYFTKEDLKEFIKIGKIMRIENNKDQELLNNEASKIYNHFISSLYEKDKSLLKLFLIVINNANKNNLNLNLNFIDLIFDSKGEKEDKINLLKEFNKLQNNNNILFFYSVKYMIQNEFKDICYMFDYGDYTEESESNHLWFIITYIQIYIEIFYKKEYLTYEEYIESIKNNFNSDEDKDDFYDIDYKDLEWDYMVYLKSLISSDEKIKITIRINPDEKDKHEEILLFKELI